MGGSGVRALFENSRAQTVARLSLPVSSATAYVLGTVRSVFGKAQRAQHGLSSEARMMLVEFGCVCVLCLYFFLFFFI